MATVRRAAPEDLARCAELLAAARREGRHSRRVALAETLNDRPATAEEWAAEWPGRVLLVGEFEGATVGLATARVAQAVVADDHLLGVVDLCYVEPGAREVGVGEALLEGLLSWCAEQGCTDVDALALPGDRRTKQLYERAGFKARLLTLHRRLG